MRRFNGAMALAAAGAAILTGAAHAQSGGDPSGHWQGSVTTKEGDLALEVDLARASGDGFKGALSVPSQDLKGVPLNLVTVQGAKVDFKAPKGAGFHGALSADGKTMAGDFSSPEGSAPITFTRTGEAVFAAPPHNPAIAAEMTGTWNGALSVAGRQLRVVLILNNNPDGTATGLFDSVDEGLRMPVAVSQAAETLTVDLPMTGAAYTARLVGEGTTLAGTFSTKAHDFPLTLTKSQGG